MKSGKTKNTGSAFEGRAGPNVQGLGVSGSGLRGWNQEI